jgi:hypothetical protein
MTEYVYALHDFLPENEDEVPFRAGGRIEVIERDDQYGDGWYQVSQIPAFFHHTPHGMCWAPYGRWPPRWQVYLSPPRPVCVLLTEPIKERYVKYIASTMASEEAK